MHNSHALKPTLKAGDLRKKCNESMSEWTWIGSNSVYRTHICPRKLNPHCGKENTCPNTLNSRIHIALVTSAGLYINQLVTASTTPEKPPLGAGELASVPKRREGEMEQIGGRILDAQCLCGQSMTWCSWNAAGRRHPRKAVSSQEWLEEKDKEEQRPASAWKIRPENRRSAQSHHLMLSNHSFPLGKAVYETQCICRILPRVASLLVTKKGPA